MLVSINMESFLLFDEDIMAFFYFQNVQNFESIFTKITKKDVLSWYEYSFYIQLQSKEAAKIYRFLIRAFKWNTIHHHNSRGCETCRVGQILKSEKYNILDLKATFYEINLSAEKGR